MIYYCLGAVLFLAAAYATGVIVFSKRRIVLLNKRHEADVRTINLLEKKGQSYKEARDHWMDGYHRLYKEYTALKATIRKDAK
jgi:hypothetical protein